MTGRQTDRQTQTHTHTPHTHTLTLLQAQTHTHRPRHARPPTNQNTRKLMHTNTHTAHTHNIKTKQISLAKLPTTSFVAHRRGPTSTYSVNLCKSCWKHALTTQNCTINPKDAKDQMRECDKIVENANRSSNSVTPPA